MVWLVVLVVSGAIGAALLLRRGMSFGASARERARPLPGDDFLNGSRGRRVVMTRAISIAAPAERVWPWIAQIGRGAGWYSIDLLDNGRRPSARHVVSWIPEPRRGDATAIGYLRYLRPGTDLAWWAGDVRFAGARARLVAYYAVAPEGNGARVVSRMSADASGLVAPLALFVFAVIDSVMASRQLIGLCSRVEAAERGGSEPPDPETGARDQFQLYEVLYAAGGSAGVAGAEHSAHWRRAAIADGVLPSDA